jgi:hypothetical protein
VKKVPEVHSGFLEHFVQNDFEKLHFSLSEFEKYLLWMFSKHGTRPIQLIGAYLNEYEKEQKDETELKPFSVQMSKYIRDHNIKSWWEYVAPQGSAYPKIIQHYLKDKDFPFEFLLFLKVFDKVPALQKKMLKSIFGKELYNLQERMEVVNRNIEFFREQMLIVNSAFKYTAGKQDEPKRDKTDAR